MPDAQDLYGALIDSAKQGVIVAGAQAELGPGRLEFDDVTSARLQVTIDGLQNLPGSFAVNGSQLGAGRRRPYHMRLAIAQRL